MSVLQQGAAPPVGTGQKQLLGRRRAGASSTADTVTDDPDLGNAILEAARAEDAAVQQRVTRSSANPSPANSVNASPAKAKSQTTSPARGKARSSTSQQPTTVHEEEEEKEKEEEEQQVSTRRTRGAVAQPEESKSPSKRARKRA